MSAAASRPAQHRWCDIDGTIVSLFCRVEQASESREPAALPSRLHQRGQLSDPPGSG